MSEIKILEPEYKNKQKGIAILFIQNNAAYSNAEKFDSISYFFTGELNFKLFKFVYDTSYSAYSIARDAEIAHDTIKKCEADIVLFYFVSINTATIDFINLFRKTYKKKYLL